jgi:hypothetical protein
MVRAAEARAQEVLAGPAMTAPLDMQCRVCELETENKRLRVLIGELLVANQQLREKAKTASGSTAA